MKSVLKRFAHDAARPVLTPIDAARVAHQRSKETSSEDERADMAQKPYRELVGSLLFAAVKTRLNISVAVNFLGQRVADPRPSDWVAAKRCLRYLKATSDFILIFPAGGNIVLEAFADADFGTGADRKSISGWLMKIGLSLVSRYCRKQKSVSLSTSEAELFASSEAVKEVK
eukprot:Plantae.Rhodophyta-Palmaria_palmata.ctg5813.p1 GENE.Plantae.Rhodophyta-Palmaria_palmata.ctg5813~~Plantae.Rhodophyta-Palmaria_palmata.ctg5813.p1  ORF type:complete len:172 (-),score=33.91 Plantae.Rhodophyta-Palmaria_palmata.ctg5813:242-757(-)